MRDFIGFALLRSVIGSENSRHSLNQLDATPTPITTWSPRFPALCFLSPVYAGHVSHKNLVYSPTNK